ncbi:MAG: ABC transporter ATP-binding protein [Tissierellia bacterium]|nr:ABC transporter ATP-binding protein [Tissierellia bacterium]
MNHSEFVNMKLKSYGKEESKALSMGLFLTIIRTIMEITGPIFVGKILNDHIKEGMTSKDIHAIIFYLVLYLVVYVMSGLFSNLARMSFEQGANKIAFHVQKDVYQHIQTLPIAYFDSLPAGNIVSRITNDTNRLKRMFQLALAELTTAGVMVIGIYLMLVILNIKVALLLLTLLPIVILIFYDMKKKTDRYVGEIRRLTADINGDINESIQNMEIIQVFHQEERMKEEFKKKNDKIFENNMGMTRLRSYGGFRAMDIIQYLATVLVLAYFGVGKITGYYAITIGSLYIAIDYTTKIFDNLKRVVSRFAEMEQSYVSAAHVFDLLRLEPAETLTKLLGKTNGEVEFSHVTFAYEEEDILKDISFKVKPGESVAFVGATGSGKSTIINLILNFYSPQKGSITIDGKDISQIDRSSLREEMAVVLQDAFLFETTVKDNVQLDGNFTEEEIKEALTKVGGEHLVKRGIDEPILERGNNLSQGEKQLISFARAYIRDPRILILDEATSNIDTETEKMIQRGIEELQKDRTTFIIAHRLSTIKNMDRIFVLHRGKIIEEGNHEELLKVNGLYKNMYEEQMQKTI